MIEKISDNVVVECNAKGCCSHSFVTTLDGVVMIDTPIVPSAAAFWKKEIKKHGSVRYIINNEPHIDHFAGSAFFSGTVVAHQGIRERIAKTPVQEMESMLQAVAPEELPLDASFRYRLPEITFSQSLKLFSGKHTFEVTTMPGHTACQTVVYVPEEKVLFASDTVPNRIMPSLHEASPFDWLDSLERLKRFDVEFVVPGHGMLGDAGLIREMESALTAAIEAVKDAIGKGWSLKEAKDRISVFSDYGDFLPGEKVRRWLRRVNVGRLYSELQ